MRSYFARVALACSLSGLTLVSVGGCNKLRSALGRGGDGGGATADPAAAGPLAMLDGFEGEIGISAKGKSMSHDGAPVLVTLLIKKGKIRVDMPPGLKGSEAIGKGYGLLHSAEKKAYFVDDAKKQAIMIELDHVGDHLKAMTPPPAHPGAPAPPPPPPPKVTKTGKTDTVAGMKCEVWEIADATNGKKADVCVADQGASWFHFPTVALPTEHAWATELMDGKHLPLRFVGYEKDGTEDGRVEVTRIDKKPMAEAQFDVPADYKIVDLAEMMKGFGAPGGMPTMPPNMPKPRAHPITGR